MMCDICIRITMSHKITLCYDSLCACAGDGALKYGNAVYIFLACLTVLQIFTAYIRCHFRIEKQMWLWEMWVLILSQFGFTIYCFKFTVCYCWALLIHAIAQNLLENPLMKARLVGWTVSEAQIFKWWWWPFARISVLVFTIHLRPLTVRHFCGHIVQCVYKCT